MGMIISTAAISRCISLGASLLTNFVSPTAKREMDEVHTLLRAVNPL